MLSAEPGCTRRGRGGLQKIPPTGRVVESTTTATSPSVTWCRRSSAGPRSASVRPFPWKDGSGTTGACSGCRVAAVQSELAGQERRVVHGEHLARWLVAVDQLVVGPADQPRVQQPPARQVADGCLNVLDARTVRAVRHPLRAVVDPRLRREVEQIRGWAAVHHVRQRGRHLHQPRPGERGRRSTRRRARRPAR